MSNTISSLHLLLKTLFKEEPGQKINAMTPQTSKRNPSPTNNKTAAGIALPVKDLDWSQELQEFPIFTRSQTFLGFYSTAQVPIKQKFLGPEERAGGKGWHQGDQFLPGEEMGISWVTNLVVASTLLILLTRTKVHTL